MKQKKVRFGLAMGVALACICCGQRAFAQPAGDDCSTAQVIACNSSTTFDNSLATTAGDDPPYSCHYNGPATQGVGTVWFSFTATDTSALVQTCASTGSGDTEIAVYEGTCGAFIELACGEDECGESGFLSRACVQGLTVGNTYFIQVASFSEFQQGLITLDIMCPCPAGPPNDECEGALSLTCDLAVTVDNTDATINQNDPMFSCGFYGPSHGAGSLWYNFTATHDTARLFTCDSETEDTLIAVYDGSCGGLVEIGCSEDACDLLSDVCVGGLIAGNTYLVQVASFGPADQGLITLNLQCPCPSTCGSCAGDINGDLSVDGGDVQSFAECYLLGGDDASCACADVVRDGGVDNADIPVFVALLLEHPGVCGTVCPPAHDGQLPITDDAFNSAGSLFESADNFVASADGAISAVRWWGPYAPAACPTGGDSFRITYFSDFNGRPGAVKAGPFHVSATRAATELFIVEGVPLWVFDATHAPVAVTAGECLWLSIVNDQLAGSDCCRGNGGLGCDDAACTDCVCLMDDFCCETEWDSICAGIAADECAGSCPPCGGFGGGQGCTWFWSLSGTGDGFMAVTETPGTWPFESRQAGDLAWCLNIDTGEAICPEPMGTCCTGTDCADTTETACFGDWTPDVTCGEFTCPLAQTGACCGGDSCANTIAANCGSQFFPGEDCQFFVCPIDSTDCCLEHETTGCQDFICQNCVCELDDFCCETEWDATCVDEAKVDCAGFCICAVPGACCDGVNCTDATDLTCAFTFFPGESCATFSCPGVTGACCTAGSCTDTTSENCFGQFFAGQACIDVICPTDSGNCCLPNGGTGCEDSTCQNCVCGIDDFCCETEWDEVCVNEARIPCAGPCTCPNPNDCCVANATPGCGNQACQDCVCALDDFCCDPFESWDGLCADQAFEDCNAFCGCDG